MAWTGAEILVVGGHDSLCPPGADCDAGGSVAFNDGAAYDPATQQWRSINDAPNPIRSAESARINEQIFFLASTSFTSSDQTLLSYDLAADSWTTLELPESMPEHRIMATDTELVIYAASNEYGPTQDWTYSPATNAWTQLPNSPLGPGFDRSYVWDGQTLYLFDKALVSSPGGASGPSLVRAVTFHNESWEVLPTSDLLGHGPILVADGRIVFPSLGCADGGQVNGYGRCIPFGAIFNTSAQTWEDLPNAPDRGQKDARSSGAVSATDVAISSVGFPYLDTSTNTWSNLPRIIEGDGEHTQPWVQGVGPFGFVFGGSDFDQSGLSGELLAEAWIWDPAKER